MTDMEPEPMWWVTATVHGAGSHLVEISIGTHGNTALHKGYLRVTGDECTDLLRRLTGIEGIVVNDRRPA